MFSILIYFQIKFHLTPSPLSLSRRGVGERFLIHFLLITLLTVNYFRPVRSIRSFKFIRARIISVAMLYGIFIFFILRTGSGALAFSLPKMEWISLFQSLVVPAIWTKSRQGNVVIFKKFQFRLDNPIRFRALSFFISIIRAGNNLIQYTFRNIFNVVWQIFA